MSSENRISHVVSVQQEPDRERRILTFKATQLVWLLFGILEALIALRIGLKLIGANPDSLIAAFIYAFTSLFLFPFTGLVSSPTYGAMELELSSMFAMVIYGLVAWAIERTVWLTFYRPRTAPVAVTDTSTSEQHLPR